MKEQEGIKGKILSSLFNKKLTFIDFQSQGELNNAGGRQAHSPLV